MKKKVFAIVLCIAMLTIAIAGGTLAYFTDEDAKTNTFTVGNVSIVLNEPNWDTTGAAEAQNVYPGEVLEKDPTVTNDGSNPCFVRIKIEGLDQYVEKYGKDGEIIYRTDDADNVLGTDWEKRGDYFYYTKVLQPGATTDALFDQIVIPFALENNESAEGIVVTAYAVQAEGARSDFADVEAMTVAEIAEWMNTCLK